MKLLNIGKEAIALAMLAGATFFGSAHAAPINSTAVYAIDFTAAGYGPGVFGTVTLTQQQDAVDVMVALTPGFAFANTGGRPAFAFNLDSGVAGATVSLVAPSVYFQAGSSGAVNPWGTFSNTIDWLNSAGGGLSESNPNPIASLSFSVLFTGIDLTDFVPSGPIMVGGGPNGPRPNPNTGGFSFIADIGNLETGVTGFAGATEGGGGDDGTPVPEPGIIGLLGVGLISAAWARRRRNR